MPVSLATSGELATKILAAVIETGDHIATNPCGPNLGRSHFLLVELPEQLFRQLEQHGAASEDDENNGDAEDTRRDCYGRVNLADATLIADARLRYRRQRR